MRDQTEFSSYSTSNPEFSEITYCSLQISNSKFTIYINHNSKSSSLPTIFHNQLNNIPLPTTINPITFNLIHQSNPKHNLQNPNIYQNQKLKFNEHIYTFIYLNLTFKFVFSNSLLFPLFFPLFSSSSSSSSLLCYDLLLQFSDPFFFLFIFINYCSITIIPLI